MTDRRVFLVVNRHIFPSSISHLAISNSPSDDIVAAFNQIRMANLNSEHDSALFESLVKSLGLTGTPDTFQTFVNDTLA